MALKIFETAGLRVALCRNVASEKIAYIIYYCNALDSVIESISVKYGVSIAVISGVDWDNDMTPWPAKRVTAGSDDFKGLAKEFFVTLTTGIIPQIESTFGLTNAERTLFGISLSGLFSLWQWNMSDLFHNIVSISGSFWYDGFLEWFDKQDYSKHNGTAIFLLGDKECKSNIKEFSTVETATNAIVRHLESQNIDTSLTMVPGNHYQFKIERLTLGFKLIYE